MDGIACLPERYCWLEVDRSLDSVRNSEYQTSSGLLLFVCVSRRLRALGKQIFNTKIIVADPTVGRKYSETLFDVAEFDPYRWDVIMQEVRQ